jgi:predicted SAM-dependent methyltransferase
MNAIVERLKRTENPLVRSFLLRARGSAHWVTHGHVVRRRVVERYLASTPEPRLQIGTGPLSLPGWLNSDLISADVYLDLTRPLPLPDASFAYVFGEHLIEHLSEQDVERLLGEVHRILRPGGVLRLTTPDLRKLLALYEDRNPVIDREAYTRFLDEETGKRHETPAQVLNDQLRLWGHRFIYDEDDLTRKLGAAGFEQIGRREPGESEHEALRGVERHGSAEWVNRAEAMCIEASRPVS